MSDHARRAVQRLMADRSVLDVRTRDRYTAIVTEAIDAATADLKRELEECREVLGEIERSSRFCPVCAHNSKWSHTPDCRLARLLEKKP